MKPKMLDEYFSGGDEPESVGFPLHHSSLFSFYFGGPVSIICGRYWSCPIQETVAFLSLRARPLCSGRGIVLKCSG